MSALERGLQKITGESNFAAALVKVQTWARSHRLLAARDGEPLGAAGDDLDPSTAQETLEEVAAALGCEPDHDSIQSALDDLFGSVTGQPADPSSNAAKAIDPKVVPLTPQQLAICKSLGTAPEDFIRVRAAMNRPLVRRRAVR